MKQEEMNELEGFSEESLTLMQRSKQAMQVPPHYFENKSLLLEHVMKEPFEVPDGYFEEQSRSLNTVMEKERISKEKGRHVRLWVSLAAAAAFVGVLFIVMPGKQETQTFSDHLHQSNLEFEDLEQIDFEEELFEEFMPIDTIVPDTVSINKVPASVDDFKPSKGQSVIDWDDIDAADIEQYLNDEESIEIIDEL